MQYFSGSNYSNDDTTEAMDPEAMMMENHSLAIHHKLWVQDDGKPLTADTP
jgi:hypothetical protein